MTEEWELWTLYSDRAAISTGSKEPRASTRLQADQYNPKDQDLTLWSTPLSYTEAQWLFLTIYCLKLPMELKIISSHHQLSTRSGSFHNALHIGHIHTTAKYGFTPLLRHFRYFFHFIFKYQTPNRLNCSILHAYSREIVTLLLWLLLWQIQEWLLFYLHTQNNNLGDSHPQLYMVFTLKTLQCVYGHF